MRIYKEVELKDFEAWSGAVDTLNELTEREKEQLQCELEMLYPEGMDETELNDLLWFENDWIAEMLGFEDWEALEEARKEDF